MEEKICYRDEIVSLLGNPVDDNPTVVIMEEAFRSLGMKYRYNTIKVYPEDLKTAVECIRAYNFKGSHITDPYKIDCIPFLDELSDSAKLIGAVNTIINKNRKLIGDNTDGQGFIAALEKANINISGMTIAVLGSDGHARAICAELGLHGAKKIYVISKDSEESAEFCKYFNSNIATEFCSVDWENQLSVPSDIDIIVNCTAIGAYPDDSVPDLNYGSFRSDTIVCDIVDNPIETPFILKARSMGCKTLNGFEMLVNLCARSFELWTEVEAPIDVMGEALLQTMK